MRRTYASKAPTIDELKGEDWTPPVGVSLGFVCPSCGPEWSSWCDRATEPSWDPTRGVRTTDADRHPYSKAYGPDETERRRLRRAAGAA